MKITSKCLLIAILCLTSAYATAQSVIEYDLYVQDTLVNFTGKTKKAIAINGQIPAPTLYFTEGDTAVIRVHNDMHHQTSVHWHGLLLPNEQDGVSYLTTAPIKPHSTHTFKFALRQSGTYWYHSHTMLQEQSGMYGAIVIRSKEMQPLPEEVILLSDWSDENPNQIERSLHYATDWYAIKKGAVQSYGEALVSGNIGTKIVNEWKRMKAMDVSDVYYDRFLLNGVEEEHKQQYKAGDRVRLRVVNGSSSTYFWLSYSGGKIAVVASDGMDVESLEVDRLLIATAETYDIVVNIPADGSYQFLATSEDRTGSASLWLGSREKHMAVPLPRLNYFEGMKMMNSMMTTDGNMKDMGMSMSLQQMDMNSAMYRELSTTDSQHDMQGMDMGAARHSEIITLNYDMLKSPTVTTLSEAPFRTLHFELTGNMNRYVWTLNNKTVSESDKIMIRKGENIRIVISNKSMMRHPMHLHGHFFRVVNSHGEYSPLKNTLDIMPMESDTIEFHAGEEYGNWFFHCHILYHMMAGMGRIFSYEDSPPNPQIPDPKMALRMIYNDDRRYYLGANIGLESNGSTGDISMMNTRWKFQTEWKLGLNDQTGYETEAFAGRYIGQKQFLMLYSGIDWRYKKGLSTESNLFGQNNPHDNRTGIFVGLQYLLPMLVTADLRLDHSGRTRVQLRRDDIPVTKRMRMWGAVNSDLEYNVGARYILTKYVSASGRYDNEMGWGFGLRFTY